ncbi:MAG: YVTN family beta-propeller repeat protein [Pseudomonadota bacterium]
MIDRRRLLTAAGAALSAPVFLSPGALRAAGGEGEIWVSNEKDDTVSVIDIASLEVIRTLPTGERPRGITFSKDFSRLYICASDSDTVQVMDPETGKILHDLPSGEDPEQFVLHPDDRRLYIANEDDAITTVVDTETRRVIAQIDVGIEPEGMAVSPDGKIAITTSETTNMAHWIDTETEELFANTLVDSRPRHAEFVKGGTELWVSAEIGGTVSVFDVATQTEKAKFGFEVQGVHPDRVQPVGFEFTGDEKTAFIALGPSNHVAAVNAETYEVEEYILVGKRVWHMAFSPDGTKLFTTNGVSGDVTVIDVESREPVKTIKVGRFPWGAAARP